MRGVVSRKMTRTVVPVSYTHLDVYKRQVEALSAAAGNAYSMIPVDNATGNFVKVEQRVPVRIALTKDNDPKQIALLRAGLNVETKVRIK